MTKNQCSNVRYGKGNFTGTMSATFTINRQDIGNLTMILNDKVYQNKNNIYKVKPKILDTDHKSLKAGTDYDSSIAYTYSDSVTLEDGTTRNAGDAVDSKDIMPVGTSIRVTVNAKEGSGYTGTISGIYRIVKADIAKASAKISAQTYTGSEIKPDKDQITLKLNKTVLEADDYEIVSYSDNIKKGNAKVVIKGVGNYGGTKIITFKIKSKGFFWWWR